MRALWIQNIVKELNLYEGPPIVYRDNQSTIKLLNNGNSKSFNTRHINVRYFKASEYIKSGELQVEYLDTDHMKADILTKPLIGAKFVQQREWLLNLFNQG